MQSIINTKMCEYKSLFGWECKEEALPNSKYCILHVDLPEDEESDEFKRINELKEKRVFNRAAIGGDALFVGAKMGRNVSFKEAEINGDVTFDCTEIKGVCSFKKAKFKYPKAQEEACRTARKTQERIGDRVEADYHFYR